MRPWASCPLRYTSPFRRAGRPTAQAGRLCYPFHSIAADVRGGSNFLEEEIRASSLGCYGGNKKAALAGGLRKKRFGLLAAAEQQRTEAESAEGDQAGLRNGREVEAAGTSS